MSWVSVLIVNSGDVGENWCSPITKVPQALHEIWFGCNRCHQGDGLVDECVLWHCVQAGSLQKVLHQDMLGDGLIIYVVKGRQIDDQQAWFFWSIRHLRGRYIHIQVSDTVTVICIQLRFN